MYQAIKVDQQTTLEAAWESVNGSSETKAAYLEQALCFGWSTTFELTPFMAYWMARNVIRDRWAAAESFIKSDQSVWKHYTAFLSLIAQFCSRSRPRKPEADPNDQVLERVVERVELFKAERRRRLLNGDAETEDEWA